MVPPIGGTVPGAAQRGGAKPPGKGQAQNRRRPCCPPARSGRRERCRQAWCRQSAARFLAARGMVPGNCPARSMVPLGMVPPIGGTGYGACNCRHGIWCRLRPARFLAARFWAAGNSPPIGGPCWPGGRSELGILRPGCGVWECGCPGTRSLGMRMSGNTEFGNADVREHGARECGAWECGCLGACGVRECGAWGKCGVRGLPAGPIGPAGTVPPDMVPPIGGTVLGGTVRCRAIARHGEWCRQSAARCTAA